MSEDFISFQKELLDTSREAIDLSRMYLEARKNYAHCFNQLQVLTQKAGLHCSKKSFENKVIELMADGVYGKEAQEINIKLNDELSTYKGLKLVIQSYLAHCSALQSVIKTQIQGELNESIKSKYER